MKDEADPPISTDYTDFYFGFRNADFEFCVFDRCALFLERMRSASFSDKRNPKSAFQNPK